MRRRRLPWLLALPLMVGGSLAAHGIASVSASPRPAAGHEGSAVAELHERASHGAPGHAVMWLGLLTALVLVAIARFLVARPYHRDGRGVGASCFFSLPLLAYSPQELIERMLHAESFPFQAALEPRFLLGLALQVPFAAAAFLLGWLLLHVGQQLVRLIGRRPPLALSFLEAQLWTLHTAGVPRVRALSRGHPLRGPPLLA